MKKIVIKYLQWNQNSIALGTVVISFLIIVSVLFGSKRPGMLDTGEYDLVLPKLGLSRIESVNLREEQYTKANETFDIVRIPIKEVLQISPAPSIVYPVFIIELFCKVFNQPFSTVYLAVLLAGILLWEIYLLIKSLYLLMKEFCALIGILMIGILLCGPYLIPLNSLYNRGMFLVSLLGFITSIIHSFAIMQKEKVNPKKVMLPVSVTGLLLVKSCEGAVVLSPIIILVLIYFGIRCMASRNRNGKCFIRVIFVTGILTYGAISFYRSSPLLFSKVNLYHSVFDGILVHSEKPEEVLKEFGLEEGLIQDVGKTAYYAEEDYYISPMNETDSPRIYDHISYAKVVQYYGRHKGQWYQTKLEMMKQSKKIETAQFIYSGDTLDMEHRERVIRSDWWNVLRYLLNSFDESGWILNVLSAVIVIVSFVQKKKRFGWMLFFLALSRNVILYLGILAAGDVSLTQVQYEYQLLTDLQFILCICWIGMIAYQISQLILYSDLTERVKEETMFEAEEYMTIWNMDLIREKVKKYRNQVKTVLKSRKVVVYASTVGCTLIMLYVLFFPRIGAYNNGDFGRMMDAMEITFTPVDFYNSEEQCGIKIIEDFDYIEPYDYSILRPDRVKLSQAYVSIMMRLLYNFTGIKFSTAIVAGFYVVILSICVFIILNALYEYLDTKTYLVAFLYALLFCGSYNLGWLNSLFGEGIGFVGFMMVMAASVGLLKHRRDAKKLTKWFVFLDLSCLFLCCGKSQYTVLTPILILWQMILTAYYCKRGILQKVLAWCGTVLSIVMLSTAALHVYRHDSSISSQDTLYQGLCFGILMVADDPKVALEELGLDPSLVQDVGKNAYLDKSEYYCAPRTQMAEEFIYSKVTTIDYLMWYLKHPRILWKMMNVAAKASAEDMPDYMLFVGQRTDSNHQTVNKFNWWKEIRRYVVPRNFIGYIIIFGSVVTFCMLKIFSHKTDGKKKLAYLLFVVMMALGVMEYPLTVIGNGFADNVKQLYMFRLVYDGMILVVVTYFMVRKSLGGEKAESKENLV